MAQTARLIAYYPYATPAELRSTSLGAARLTPAQIADYASQIAKFTRTATWTVDTNTVGVFVKIANCADQDAVAQMATTRMVGREKTVYGSLAEARRIKKMVCPTTGATPPPAVKTGVSTTTKLLIAGAVVTVAGVGGYMLMRRPR